MATEAIGSSVFGLFVGLDQFKRQLGQARTMADTETSKMQQSMSQKMGSVGSTLTKTLTPAAGAFAAFSAVAFKQFDAGMDAIAAKTGATGAELAAMGDSMKRVGSDSTQGLGQVGEMMGDLAARTGMTGKPLEELTARLLALDEIGQSISAESITRLFGDWSVATEHQSDTLDRLFRVSQDTGVSIQKISDLMVRAGGPLRQLGFSFDEGAAMMARFEKEGVNTELVLSGMKQALGNFAKAGRDPAVAFDELVTSIKNATTAGEANSIALKAMGVEAGPDFAAAVREGRFELDTLTGSMAEGETSILAARDANRGLIDKLVILKNKAMAVVGPFGEMGMAVGGLAAGLGPAMQGMSALAPLVSKVGASFLTAMPWIAAFAAAILIGYLIFKHWDEIKAFFARTFDWLKDAFGGVGDFFAGVWDGIVETAKRAGNVLLGAIQGYVNLPLNAINLLMGMIADFGFTYDGYKIWGVQILPAFTFKPFSFMEGWKLPTLNLPELAAGGTARRGGLSIVGELGPELLHLPTGADVIPLDRTGGMGGGSAGVEVVQLVVDGRVLAEVIRDRSVDLGRRGGRAVA